MIQQDPLKDQDFNKITTRLKIWDQKMALLCYDKPEIQEVYCCDTVAYKQNKM